MCILISFFFISSLNLKSMAATMEDKIYPIWQLREKLAKKDVMIAQKDKLIAGKDATIARLKSESAQKDSLLVEMITEKNDIIASLMAECVQKSTVIVEMDKLIAEKDERISKHKVRSAEINNEIAEMKKVISEKDDAITKEREEVEFFIDRLIKSMESNKFLDQRAVEAEEMVQHLQGEIKAMKEAEKGELLMAQIQAIDEFKLSNEYRDAVLECAMDFLEEALSCLRKKASRGECKFSNEYWDDVFKSSVDILEGCLSDFRKKASS